MADLGLGELVERSGELDVIRAATEAVAAGEGRAVVVEGAAGIGKSALVAAAHARACEAGLTPLSARGTELERAFGYGVVRQLLEPAVHDGDGAAAFEGAARHAAALLDVPLAEPAPLPFGPEGAFAVLHGLYRLTANFARHRPLALPVDDAHWADGASLRFLAYLAGRLSHTPVLLVVAARPLGEPGGAAVAELLAEGGAPVLVRPGALSESGSAKLVRTAVPEALSFEDVLGAGKARQELWDGLVMNVLIGVGVGLVAGAVVPLGLTAKAAATFGAKVLEGVVAEHASRALGEKLEDPAKKGELPLPPHPLSKQVEALEKVEAVDAGLLELGRHLEFMASFLSPRDRVTGRT